MMSLDELRWDAAGLVTVVVQDRFSGEIRMLAHANREALEATLHSGQAHFYSRSRGMLWRKGESSGHTLSVSEVWLDCDGDAVLYLVEPAGPTCHTGRPSCFYRKLPTGLEGRAATTLPRLWGELRSRKQASSATSYTRKLLDGGPEAIGAKLREEADELARAIADESDPRVASEAADLLYHLLVGLLQRGVDMQAVAKELDRRSGVSGLVEKASRQKT